MIASIIEILIAALLICGLFNEDKLAKLERKLLKGVPLYERIIKNDEKREAEVLRFEKK